LITSLGTGSGIDVNTLANALANAEIDPQKNNIQSQIDKSNATISGYSAIKYVLSNLQSAFGNLRNLSNYNSVNGSSTDPNAFNITPGDTATTGTHNVVVTSIAQPQRFLSAGFSSSTQSLNAGQALTFTIQNASGTPTSIQVAAGQDTPQGIINAINTSGSGVQASLVNTGTATNPYSILLTGNTGAVNAFAVGEAPLVNVASNSIQFGTGLNAGQSVTIAGLTLTASSNMTAAQVASAFSGLADGATTASPSISTGSFTGALTGFSTGALAAGSTTLTYTSTSNSTAGPSVKSVDSLFQWTSLQNASNAQLNVDGVAITSASNSVKDAIPGVTLDLMAPTSNANGATVSLSRDTTNVKANIQALVSAYNDVITELGVVSDPKSTVPTYGATLVGNSIVTTVESQVRQTVIGDSNTPSGSMKALRDIGVTIDQNGQLQIDSTKLDTALNNNFNDVVTMLSNNQQDETQYNPTPGGLAGDAYKKITSTLDPLTGPLTTLTQDQNNKIADYQKQLDALQTRLQDILKRYTDQFTAMDSMVGQIKSTQAGLTSTFAGMMAAYTKN
jgi:flagellar hook-associated protein 2